MSSSSSQYSVDMRRSGSGQGTHPSLLRNDVPDDIVKGGHRLTIQQLTLRRLKIWTNAYKKLEDPPHLPRPRLSMTIGACQAGSRLRRIKLML